MVGPKRGCSDHSLTHQYYRSHERFLRQFNTNTFGVLNTTRAFLPHFRAKRAGVLVFVGSVGGASGEAGAGAYCGSKFAVEGKDFISNTVLIVRSKREC